MSAPSILALDFDGVVCDGLAEYFDSAWRAHARLRGVPETDAPAGLAERFYALRPVVESGWEMPLVIQALQAGIDDAEVRDSWPALAPNLLEGRATADVGAALDRVRDQLIASDLEGWLGRHRFYPGVIDRLRALAAGPTDAVIITTKEGRFVRELLSRAGLPFPADRIHGKESKRPKADVLRALKEPGVSVWFVEDRIKTLDVVAAQPDLADVRLFLADWGYNFPAEREAARRSERIALLSLAEVARDFSAWPASRPAS